MCVGGWVGRHLWLVLRGCVMVNIEREGVWVYQIAIVKEGVMMFVL